GRALEARLLGTFAGKDEAGVRYRLLAPDAREAVATVEESVRGRRSAAGSGFARSFAIAGSGRLRLRAAEPGPQWVASGFNWMLRRRSDGAFEALAARGLSAGEVLALSDGAPAVTIDLVSGATRAIEIETILAPSWSEGVQAAWM